MPKQLEAIREDFPAIAADGSGTVWAAWLRYETGKDSLRVARLREPAAAGNWNRDREWTLRAPGQIAGQPTLAALSASVWLAAPVENAGKWDIYAWHIDPRGPGDAIAVTNDAVTDGHPTAAATKDGSIWLAWESNRGGDRAIFAASSGKDGKFGAAQRISSPGFNAYNPSLTTLGNGVAVAYDSIRDSNSDIYLRLWRAGSWGEERRLTSGLQLDRHPFLAQEKGRLWVAWEAQEFDIEKYRMNHSVAQTVRMARIEPDGMSAPVGIDGADFANWVSRPSVAFDAQDRLWLALRLSTSQHGGWETIYYCYTGDRWQKMESARIQGRIRGVPMVFTSDRLAAAQQIDDVARQADSPGHPEWYSNVIFPSFDLTKAPRALPLKLEKYREPAADAFTVKQARAARAEDGPARGVSYQGQKLNLYWGDLHEHSNVSICNRRGNPAPEDLYANLRDIARLDFAGITDHGYNIDDYIWSWNAKQARLNDDPGRFVTFHAQEWTSSFVPPAEPGGLRRYGHRNLFFADSFFSRSFNARDGKTPRQVWDELKGVNYITIPHQLADTGNCPTDWNYTDDVLQPVAEIYQNRGSYEYLNNPKPANGAMEQTGHFIQDAWARGIVIGVIASPDHGGGQGKAAVYAGKLDRESILNAVRERHTYGTTGAKIFLEVRVNGHLMGEKLPALPAGQPVDVSVRVIGAGVLTSVEVCRNNRFVYTKPGEGRSAEFVFRDNVPPAGRLWYYVRVIQKDGEMAWSSPVWLGA